MALGAQGKDVLLLVIGQGIKLIAICTALGLAGAFAVTRLLKSVLYVCPTDTLTYVAMPLMLSAVVLLACWIPVRRATKIDPMIALRCE